MKKTLAIVLALVMVLCMIPAMSAESTTVKTVSDKQYDLKVSSVGTASSDAATATKANSITFKYDYEKEDKDVTGKWSEDAKMATVEVSGFDEQVVGADKIQSITIDGKALDADEHFNKTEGKLDFPIELTKAGYSDTYLVQIVAKKGDVVTTETAKISVKLINTAAYKDAKTAYITNIASTKNDMSAYIVGDKIYLDLADESTNADVKFTFADENRKAFSVITYVREAEPFRLVGGETKLDKSAATFVLAGNTDGTVINHEGAKVAFKLETKNALYETKEYVVKVRTNIKPEDPKGIYFAESTKTIAMGKTYTPVVMGVKTGKAVAAELVVPDKTDRQVIDLNDDKDTVIGTREGVAYITATYTVPGTNGNTYTASSMKIIVTAGESIPPADNTTIYYVTCRNLNVRKGAGTSYAKAGMIHRGDAVKVVEIKNGWAKLDNGTYVASKYIAK